VALDPSTVLMLKRRHGETYLAQLTRKDTFIENDATFGTVDEDVLETANIQARGAVKERLGEKPEDFWAVIDLTPYFLMAPGSDAAEVHWNSVFEKLTPQPANSATTATDPDDASEDDRRRYSGDDFENDANVQNLGRPRRSSF
jgi:hypothetical protein